MQRSSLGRADGHRRRYRRHRLARAARRVQGADQARDSEDRHAERRRSDRDRERLLFIGSTTDAQFRAFDSKTGRELWAATLPNDAIATPLTYLGRDGKQYVATVAGGGLDNFVRPPLEAPRPNVLVAFKLP